MFIENTIRQLEMNCRPANPGVTGGLTARIGWGLILHKVKALDMYGQALVRHDIVSMLCEFPV
jgi:hypothetical protein